MPRSSPRALGAILATIALAACSSDGGTDPTDDRPIVVRTLSGDGQVAPVAVTPTDELPEPVAIMVGRDKDGRVTARIVRASLSVAARGAPGDSVITSDLAPIPGTPVSWRVVDDDCGEPFAVTTLTGSDGIVRQRWIKGTRATECRMVAVNVDPETGNPIVYGDTIRSTIEPGPVESIAAMAQPPGGPQVRAGATIDLNPIVLTATDQYANMIDHDALGARLTWGLRLPDQTSPPSRTTPQGSGYLVVLPADAATGEGEIYLWAGRAERVLTFTVVP